MPEKLPEKNPQIGKNFWKESGRDDETEMAINYCIWQPFPDDAE